MTFWLKENIYRMIIEPEKRTGFFKEKTAMVERKA